MLKLNKILTLCEILALRLADLTITEIPCASLEDQNKLRYSRKLLPYAARFIDLDRFKITVPFNDRENIIGFVGRLEKDKGVIELVRAIEILRCNFPYLFREMTFYFIGDGSLKSFVSKKARDIGNIKVFGYVPHNELPKYLNELKLLVLPSRKEGIPTVLLEAMACGVIVIATPVGGIPTIISKSKAGFLLKSTEPGEIARTVIKTMYMDKTKLAEMSEKARKFVVRYFSSDSAVLRYSLVFKALLNYKNEK